MAQETKTVWCRIAATIECTPEQLDELMDKGWFEGMTIMPCLDDDAYIPGVICERLGYADADCTIRPEKGRLII